MYIRRIDIKEVPEGEKEAATWLSDLIVKKDETLDHFHQTGKFNVDVDGKCFVDDLSMFNLGLQEKRSRPAPGRW